MKLTFLPTLTDMREMLGDRLYVEFVWAWREQEQEKRQKDNRARWADQLPERTAITWPQPLVVRDILDELPEPMPAQVALLHPNKRLLEQKRAGAVQNDAERAAAAMRLRNAGIRSAAE